MNIYAILIRLTNLQLVKAKMITNNYDINIS